MLPEVWLHLIKQHPNRMSRYTNHPMWMMYLFIVVCLMGRSPSVTGCMLNWSKQFSCLSNKPTVGYKKHHGLHKARWGCNFMRLCWIWNNHDPVFQYKSYTFSEQFTGTGIMGHVFEVDFFSLIHGFCPYIGYYIVSKRRQTSLRLISPKLGNSYRNHIDK